MLIPSYTHIGYNEAAKAKYQRFDALLNCKRGKIIP